MSIAKVTKFSGEEDLLTAASVFEPLSDELLVRVRSIDVTRVPECAAKVGGFRQYFSGLLVVVAAKGSVCK